MRFYKLENKETGEPYTKGVGGVYSGQATIIETREDTPETRRELTDPEGFPVDGWIWSF